MEALAETKAYKAAFATHSSWPVSVCGLLHKPRRLGVWLHCKPGYKLTQDKKNSTGGKEVENP